jgi:hypothetical protein
MVFKTCAFIYYDEVNQLIIKIMNLTLFFRLIVTILFQPAIRSCMDKNGPAFNYDNAFFFCPRIIARDNFNVSLQIHKGNYCSSENGYRSMGFTFNEVEFGFTSVHEPLMDVYAETPGDTTKTVGNIPLSIMEKVFEKHGGIDWEKTLSVDVCKNFTKLL